MDDLTRNKLEWADAAFAACVYLDRAVPVLGRTNDERIRFAADEILRLRAELAALNDGDRVVLPKNLNHAKAMRLVAMHYIEQEVAGDPVRGVHHQGTQEE